MFTFSYLLTNLFFHYIMNCCSSELEWYKHNTQLVHTLIKINEKILTISLIQNSRWGPTYLYLKDFCEDRVTYLSIHWLTGKGKKGSLAKSVLAALYSCSMPTPPSVGTVQSLKIKYIPKVIYEKGERESQSEWAWLANLKKKKKSPAPYNQKGIVEQCKVNLWPLSNTGYWFQRNPHSVLMRRAFTCQEGLFL